MVAPSEFVAVTGASGYLATELVSQLLSKGYNVKATVRNPDDEVKTAHLRALGEALPGILTLHAADLLQPGSFDDVIRGATYVYHTASPFQIFNIKDPQTQLIDPAVKGTRNVFDSVLKTKDTVRRVVVTSSIAAVRGTVDPQAPLQGGLYTEEDWNQTSSIDNGEGYARSKVLAEKLAWQIAKEHSLSVVTINPGYIIGPVISARTDAASVQLLKGILEGEQTIFSKANVRYVDVRDVARAHIAAAEQPDAEGRYIICQPQSTPGREVTDILKAAGFEVPDGESHEAFANLDITKLNKGLGIQLTPVPEALADMARTMIGLGVADNSKAAST